MVHSYHQTEDAVITRIFEAPPRVGLYERLPSDNRTIWLEARVSPRFDEYDYLRARLTKSSFKSAFGICGIDAIEFIPPGYQPRVMIDDKGKPYRSATLITTSWSHLHHDVDKLPMGQLFTIGMPITKFYVEEPKDALQRSQVLAYVNTGHSRLPKEYKIREDGLILTPTRGLDLWVPGPEWSERTLKDIVAGKIKRLDLVRQGHIVREINPYHREGILVRKHGFAVAALENFYTGSKEGVVEYPAVHGNARFHSSHTPTNSNGLFFLEFFGNHIEDVMVEEVGIRLYEPVPKPTHQPIAQKLAPFVR